MSKAAKRERQRQNREARRLIEDKLRKRQARLRFLKGLAPLIALVVGAGVVISLTRGGSTNSGAANPVTCKHVKSAPAAKTTTFPQSPPLTVDPAKFYFATLHTTCGTITVSLNASEDPVAVNNFVFLANQGFYDGLVVNRSAKSFVIQSGSPDQTQAGGPGYSLLAEVPVSTPAYTVGSLAMAKGSSDPGGTVGSQWFIVTGHPNSLSPDYAPVGSVITGLDVAKKINTFAPKGGDGPPTRTIVVTSVAITVRDATTTTTG